MKFVRPISGKSVNWELVEKVDIFKARSVPSRFQLRRQSLIGTLTAGLSDVFLVSFVLWLAATKGIKMVDPKVIQFEALDFFRRTMRYLKDAKIPFMVGGAYALNAYTGIQRHTKDLDLFVRREDVDEILEVLESHGLRTEITFSHWLAKAYCGDIYIDIIFSSGNAISEVDEEWFEYAKDGDVLGIRSKLCPLEEMLWSKAFIMERERFDGADVAHILGSCATMLDWDRLLRRFGPHWRVLLTHLILFGFIYPAQKSQIPPKVMRELMARLQDETIQRSEEANRRVCQGTLLSREQYLVDLERWGYADARRIPMGNMTEEQVVHWTEAIQHRH